MPNYGHLSLSCYIFERVNKGRKPPKRDLAGRGTRIPKGSVSHCRSRIHRALSHIATNAATFVSRGCGGYTLAFANRIAHNGSHGETRGVSDGGVVSLPSERFAWFGNPAWPGVRAANFAVLGSWPGARPKNAESLRNSDALMRVAVSRRRGPAGLRDPIAVSLTALIGFTVLADRDYRVRKKAHFVFMHRAALPALPAPSAALMHALMH